MDKTCTFVYSRFGSHDISNRHAPCNQRKPLWCKWKGTSCLDHIFFSKPWVKIKFMRFSLSTGNYQKAREWQVIVVSWSEHSDIWVRFWAEPYKFFVQSCSQFTQFSKKTRLGIWWLFNKRKYILQRKRKVLILCDKCRNSLDFFNFFLMKITMNLPDCASWNDKIKELL